MRRSRWHGPEKETHRLPSCLPVFANDKAVTQTLYRKMRESYTLEASPGQTRSAKSDLASPAERCRFLSITTAALSWP